MMSHVVVWYTLVVFTMSATAETLYAEGAALSNHSCRPADCVDLQCFNVVFENCGPLRVYPDDGAYVRVSCEVDPGGGWTVMQRRLDGRVNFTQPWQDYRDGFGQHGAATELWHGNENVRRMCSQRPQRMLIEMVSFDDESAFVMYDNFSLADEEHKYKLTYDNVTWSTNVTGDDLATSRDQYFSTFDDDNSPSGLCSSETYYKGWWYADCFRVHLNGQFPRGFDRPPTANRWRYLVAYSFRQEESLRSCKMKLRPMTVGDDVAAYCARNRKNPCLNGGTCVYVHATNTSMCQCRRHTCGELCSECEDPVPRRPSETSRNFVPLIVGVVALLLVALIAGGSMHYTDIHDREPTTRSDDSWAGKSTTELRLPAMSQL